LKITITCSSRSYSSSFADRRIDALAEYAPNIHDSLIHRQVISPLDLESESLHSIALGQWRITAISSLLTRRFAFIMTASLVAMSWVLPPVRVK
jgi:hypothetical protein